MNSRGVISDLIFRPLNSVPVWDRVIFFIIMISIKITQNQSKEYFGVLIISIVIVLALGHLIAILIHRDILKNNIVYPTEIKLNFDQTIEKLKTNQDLSGFIELYRDISIDSIKDNKTITLNSTVNYFEHIFGSTVIESLVMNLSKEKNNILLSGGPYSNSFTISIFKAVFHSTLTGTLNDSSALFNFIQERLEIVNIVDQTLVDSLLLISAKSRNNKLISYMLPFSCRNEYSATIHLNNYSIYANALENALTDGESVYYYREKMALLCENRLTDLINDNVGSQSELIKIRDLIRYQRLIVQFISKKDAIGALVKYVADQNISNEYRTSTIVQMHLKIDTLSTILEQLNQINLFILNDTQRLNISGGNRVFLNLKEAFNDVLNANH